jgi:signal transduction histidine kinase
VPLSDEICIAVEDHGIGIDTSDLPHIFDPFYRSPAVAAAQIHGTGLGLPLAKSIAEAMGGKITVVTKLGVGSVFTLHLPALKKGTLQTETISPDLLTRQ